MNAKAVKELRKVLGFKYKKGRLKFRTVLDKRGIQKPMSVVPLERRLYQAMKKAFVKGDLDYMQALMATYKEKRINIKTEKGA